MKAHDLAAAVTAMALTVACSETDAGVTASVKARLAADNTVKARDINVESQEHIVTLRGRVQTAQEQSRALQIARQTAGVVEVVDQLSVASDETRPTATSGRVEDNAPSAGTAGAVPDPGITANVKAKLLADSTVKGLQIDVDTKDRVVTLSGTVDTQTQKDHALEITRSVDRVARVEDKLTVRNPSR